MYFEPVPETATGLSELQNCLARESEWKNHAHNAERNLMVANAKPTGTKATIVRSNGTRINVLVWQRTYKTADSTGPNRITYQFRQPYTHDLRLRLVPVKKGDIVEWDT